MCLMGICPIDPNWYRRGHALLLVTRLSRSEMEQILIVIGSVLKPCRNFD